MVLGIGQQDGPKPKCYFTQAPLPSYIDNAHPPTKKEPFRTVLDQQYSHNISLLLPASSTQQALQDKLSSSGDGTLSYARVFMKPLDLISGEFFNSYMKAGNIIMLSEGRSGTDNVLSLSDGVLRIEVDKPTYEKLGLEGRAVGGEGKKHVRARFVIEINLRLPSMLPGHKAFERLQWAFKNVLDASLAWLFYDLRSPLTVNGEVQGALAAHAPTINVLEPSPEPLQPVLCPSFHLSEDISEEDAREEVAELLEWLSLTMSRSPRVQKGGSMDPFLCRYRPAEGATPIDLVRYQWRGFAPAAFVLTVLLAAMKASSSSTTAGDGWFALSSASFDGKGYTILKHGSEVLTWNYAD
ncbi:hypothetical protein Q7P35_010091 [Cladosporium inversicolor]